MPVSGTLPLKPISVGAIERGTITKIVSNAQSPKGRPRMGRPYQNDDSVEGVGYDDERVDIHPRYRSRGFRPIWPHHPSGTISLHSSKAGVYFVTIYTQGCVCLFGDGVKAGV